MKLSQPVWTRSLPTPVVLGWATLGPIGRRLPAPGTWGSVAGLLYFTVLFLNPADRGEPLAVGVVSNLLLSAIGGYVAVALCGEAELRLGRHDPGEVILDEFVAMPLCFLAWPRLEGPLARWQIFLLGFALFRLFDIAKPFGISRLQRLPGGWGVVLDDTAAALATCATLHLGQWAWHHYHG
jgi:phosphatidylglycerophosphatase A